MIPKLKTIIKYNMKLIINWINNDNNKSSLCSSDSYFSYDKLTRRFSINSDLTQENLVNVRRILMSELRTLIPQSHIMIDEIITGYYDQCLERYLYEKLNRSYNNIDTCWFKYAQNNKCIGRQENGDSFDEKKKKEFYNKLLELHPMKNIDKGIINTLEKNDQGYVFSLSDNVITKDDKVLSLYHNIKNLGYSNAVSALDSPIIIDYSLKNKKFNLMAGRHRIAVLRYLRSQGEIKNIKIRCHIVEHPYESLIYTRPYTESCKRCNWGEIYDPGKGTHQDYYIREGIAVMRGDPGEKGGRQKWEKIEPIFRNFVENKTILDLGSHRGLYLLKALEYGSKQVTAFDNNDNHIYMKNCQEA